MLKHHADITANFINLFYVSGKLRTIDNNRTLLMLFQSIDAADQGRLA